MTPSGWCLTNNHSICRVVIGDRTCPCTCSNHGVDYVPGESGASERITEIIDRYKIKAPKTIPTKDLAER